MTNDWKPGKCESYFLVSEYSDQPYAYVWEGNKADRDRHAHKTLYRTREEAMDIIIARKGIKRDTVDVLGIPLQRWTNKSCTADFGVGPDWATLYDIRSAEEGKGHATELLRAAKAYYEGTGKKFGGSVALNDRMRGIYRRLGITEYA